MRKFIAVLSVMVVLVLAGGAVALAQDGDAILGKWLTEEGKAQVEIYKCKDTYCGKMVWLKVPNDDAGKPKTDTKNPDAAKQSRPLLGLNMLWSLKYVGENNYADGGVYAADSGKTYSLKATLKGDTLDLRGFMGISLLGKTQTWTRVK